MQMAVMRDSAKSAGTIRGDIRYWGFFRKGFACRRMLSRSKGGRCSVSERCLSLRFGILKERGEEGILHL